MGGMRRVSTQIRMPEDLHRHLEQMARRQFRSLNSLIVQTLAELAERDRREHPDTDHDRGTGERQGTNTGD